MYSLPFISNLVKVVKPSPHVFDDMSDRFNYFATSTILFFCALLVGAKQNIGSPIQCWLPKEFGGSWEQYAEDLCFIQGSYFMHMDKPLGHKTPDAGQLRQHAQPVNYYQWVPFVLVAQAIMFSVPHFFWKNFCEFSGIHMMTIMKMAGEAETCHGEERRAAVLSLAGYVEETLGTQHDLDKEKLSFFRRSYCSYMSRLYVFTKLLYLLNILIQFFMTSSFVGFNFFLFGADVLHEFKLGAGWQDTGRFPRVTHCDFSIRAVGTPRSYNVQCVLMIQMFNEKIYAFLWFWWIMLAVVTTINACYWAFQILLPSCNQKLVRKYLRITNTFHDGGYIDERLVSRFVSNTLHADGVLILRFVAGHHGNIVAALLVSELWNLHRQRVHQDHMTLKSPSTIKDMVQNNNHHGRFPSDHANGDGHRNHTSGIVENIYPVNRLHRSRKPHAQTSPDRSPALAMELNNRYGSGLHRPLLPPSAPSPSQCSVTSPLLPGLNVGDSKISGSFQCDGSDNHSTSSNARDLNDEEKVYSDCGGSGGYPGPPRCRPPAQPLKPPHV